METLPKQADVENRVHAEELHHRNSQHSPQEGDGAVAKTQSDEDLHTRDCPETYW